MYDIEGPRGEGWYLYEYEWFGEHPDISPGDFADVELLGVNADEVVVKLNGKILMRFKEEFTTSAGLEEIRLRQAISPGLGQAERCPDGICVDARFDYVQLRGLQGEEPSPRPHVRPTRPLTPLTWKIGR